MSDPILHGHTANISIDDDYVRARIIAPLLLTDTIPTKNGHRYRVFALDTACSINGFHEGYPLKSMLYNESYADMIREVGQVVKENFNGIDLSLKEGASKFSYYLFARDGKGVGMLEYRSVGPYEIPLAGQYGLLELTLQQDRFKTNSASDLAKNFISWFHVHTGP